MISKLDRIIKEEEFEKRKTERVAHLSLASFASLLSLCFDEVVRTKSSSVVFFFVVFNFQV